MLYLEQMYETAQNRTNEREQARHTNHRHRTPTAGATTQAGKERQNRHRGAKEPPKTDGKTAGQTLSISHRYIYYTEQ